MGRVGLPGTGLAGVAVTPFLATGTPTPRHFEGAQSLEDRSQGVQGVGVNLTSSLPWLLRKLPWKPPYLEEN